MKKFTNHSVSVASYFKSLNLILLFCFSAFLLFCSSTLMAQPTKKQFPDSSFEGEGWKYNGKYWDFETDKFYTLNSLCDQPAVLNPQLTAYKECGTNPPPPHGNCCIRLESVKIGVGDAYVFLPGMVGTITKEFVTEYTTTNKASLTVDWAQLTPHAMEWWYKYDNKGGDSAMIQIGFKEFPGIDEPLIVDERFIIKEHPTSKWTRGTITIPAEYRGEIFSEIQVLFVASAGVKFDDMMKCDGREGAKLWIDNISLIYELGIKQNLFSTLKANAFPNPATEVLNLELNEVFTGVIWVYDLSGKKILETNISGTQAQLNISSLASGNYIYRLMNENTIFAQGKFVVAK